MKKAVCFYFCLVIFIGGSPKEACHLGGVPCGISGSKYANGEGRMYLMEFSKFPGAVFPIPTAEGEDWEIIDELWTEEQLSARAEPA